MIFGTENVSMKHDVAACLQIRCWLCTDCAWSRTPKVIVHFLSFCQSDPSLALTSPRSRSFKPSAHFSVQLLVKAVFNVFRRAQSGDIDRQIHLPRFHHLHQLEPWLRNLPKKRQSHRLHVQIDREPGKTNTWLKGAQQLEESSRLLGPWQTS